MIKMRGSWDNVEFDGLQSREELLSQRSQANGSNYDFGINRPMTAPPSSDMSFGVSILLSDIFIGFYLYSIFLIWILVSCYERFWTISRNGIFTTTWTQRIPVDWMKQVMIF